MDETAFQEAIPHSACQDWLRQGEGFAAEVVAQWLAIESEDPGFSAAWDLRRSQLIDALHTLGHRREARALVHRWLLRYRERLQALPSRAQAQRESLWRCLADVVERTADQGLLELFWESLAPLQPPLPSRALPLLGVPILNRFDLLERLLNSLDHPVETLAVVDNSDGRGELRERLQDLVQHGHPLIQQIKVATPFGNLGVAGSWNLILRSFPEAAGALLTNNDVLLSSEALSTALASIDWQRPCFLPLLPSPNSFSAFLLTAHTWNLVGLFDDNFHPAYCEDVDYQERLQAQPQVHHIELPALQRAMAACNPDNSATINSDPALAACNRISFQLNRLWLLSRRRHLSDHRGTWTRRWLCQWTT